jgi:hypothetical protein
LYFLRENRFSRCNNRHFCNLGVISYALISRYRSNSTRFLHIRIYSLWFGSWHHVPRYRREAPNVSHSSLEPALRLFTVTSEHDEALQNLREKKFTSTFYKLPTWPENMIIYVASRGQAITLCSGAGTRKKCGRTKKRSASVICVIIN